MHPLVCHSELAFESLAGYNRSQIHLKRLITEIREVFPKYIC
jgi:hypothetical protein